MTYESIRHASAAGIARVTLNRPDRLNSFTAKMHEELRDALATVRADTSARVLLLTGAGRGFCAGQDLSDRAVAPGDAPVDLGASIEANYRPLVLALQSFPMPVVCAVNGVAAGAGANIALACDLVVAAQVGELHPGVLQDRADSGLRRNVFPAATGRDGARDGARAARRQAVRRSRRRTGASSGNASTTPNLAPTVEALLAQLAQAPTRGLVATRKRIARARRRRHSKRSSTSNAICSANWGTARTTAKASRRSSTSVRRGSPGK